MKLPAPPASRIDWQADHTLPADRDARVPALAVLAGRRRVTARAGAERLPALRPLSGIEVIREDILARLPPKAD